MKAVEVLVEYKTPKKPKARPKKTLWFNHPALWKNDLDFSRAGHKLWQEEEEGVYYATDETGEMCHGAWYPKRNAGVTFATPRPKHTLVHPRKKLKPYVSPPPEPVHSTSSRSLGEGIEVDTLSTVSKIIKQGNSELLTQFVNSINIYQLIDLYTSIAGGEETWENRNFLYWTLAHDYGTITLKLPKSEAAFVLNDFKKSLNGELSITPDILDDIFYCAEEALNKYAKSMPTRDTENYDGE